MQVHLTYQPEGKALEVLREHVNDLIDFSFGPVIPSHRKIEVLVGGRPERQMLEEHRDHLQALIIPWAGVPTNTRDLLGEYPRITVHNLHHNAVATAELAVSLLLAAAKQIIPYDRALRDHDWRMRYQSDRTLLLHDRKALILGYGEIGRRVGQALQGLNMQVIGVRRHQDEREVGGVTLYGPDHIPELLTAADCLLLTLPLTEETRGMIGARELALLPDHAVLVNVSRGPIVDQGALFRALQAGKIYGAGLDVWYNYPNSEENRNQTPPADYAFHSLENVVLSPHRGGKSPRVEVLRMRALAELLYAAARGETMPNRVDLKLGY